MKKAVVFLFLCVAAAPAAAQTLSLEECRAAAVEHNRTLRNSRLDLDAASQTHRQAFTNYFPQISASGGLFQAQHGLVQADFAVPQMGTLPVSMVKRGIVGSVTAVQPLFAGLKIVTGNYGNAANSGSCKAIIIFLLPIRGPTDFLPSQGHLKCRLLVPIRWCACAACAMTISPVA